MSARDRLIFMLLGVVAVLGAVWILAVSPARKQASKVSGEVGSARSQLAQAQAEAAEARSAQSRYHVAYASLTQVGQAVPTSPDVPALVYALDKASNNHNVQFSSITTGGASGSSSASSPSSSPAAAQAPFTQMPFTLTFNGSYGDLIHLLGQIEHFTVQPPGGPVEVSGRLLTIQGITLALPTSGSGGGASAASSNEMTWTITATAYVLAPAAQSSTPTAGGARASGPTSSSGPGASTATPAVVRANG